MSAGVLTVEQDAARLRRIRARVIALRETYGEDLTDLGNYMLAIIRYTVEQDLEAYAEAAA